MVGQTVLESVTFPSSGDALPSELLSAPAQGYAGSGVATHVRRVVFCWGFTSLTILLRLKLATPLTGLAAQGRFVSDNNLS